ncbi:uncharacterized protein LOC132752810 isoform X2 [Ruditapes philippinarum]|uniref:uncharacterized protein LOC132752810 isoform X2 n=1 Tax=Ruditapes philippinarum TaxID=129788 RepID=UPI00295B8D18|nr:uncharacterized protein LOC132752810 isoform X2 [Ruditapes philippinarum]
MPEFDFSNDIEWPTLNESANGKLEEISRPETNLVETGEDEGQQVIESANGKLEEISRPETNLVETGEDEGQQVIEEWCPVSKRRQARKKSDIKQFAGSVIINNEGTLVVSKPGGCIFTNINIPHIQAGGGRNKGEKTRIAQHKEMNDNDVSEFQLTILQIDRKDIYGSRRKMFLHTPFLVKVWFTYFMKILLYS